MTVTDSIPSSDNNQYTHDAVCISVASQSTATADTCSDRFGYFVPLIMLIVLAVTVFATFFDKKDGRKMAALTPSEQSSATAAPIKDSAEKGGSASAEPAEVESAVSDLAALNANMAGSETAADQFQNKLVRQAVTTGQGIPGHGRSGNHANAYAYSPPSPLRVFGKHSGEYHEITHARRKAYDASMQTPGRHRQQMRAYRDIVLKRIRQDRRDRRQHIQDSYREGQYTRRNLINRSELLHQM